MQSASTTSAPASRRGKSGSTPTPAPPSITEAAPTVHPQTSFYSCISIPVQGATPAEEETSQIPDAMVEDADSTRAPRKSKTDALAALQEAESAVNSDREASEPPDLLAEHYRNVEPISVPKELDLKTVRTSAPRYYQRPKHVAPVFDLEEVPTYYPDAEQFKDPMAYVNSIADEAKAYGICKVVPPEGWVMPFVTDTETFRFNARLQRLNSIEASSRAKINFLEQLYRFHKQQGNPRVVVPTINSKPLDLWLLKKEVNALGGYDAVNRDKKWADLGRLLGFRGVQNLTGQIKQSYIKIILPYEIFCERNRSTSASPFKPSSSRDTGGLTSPLTPPSAKNSDDEMDEDGLGSSRSRRRKRSEIPATPLKSPSIVTPTELPAVLHNRVRTKTTKEAHCEICFKDDEGTQMLLCDGCDCGYHMFCLTPRVKNIPKGSWYCHACLTGSGRDYGFDEGDEHTLQSFQARDREFRRFWFGTHPPKTDASSQFDPADPTLEKIGQQVISEQDIEREFWRLVENPHETVEVEYGADVHSTTHGSAMPSMELHPLNKYAKDPWNLNNIPIVSDSLLRFIKSDISGMTVPWTYVGMTFSTFCWHNEDHYTYSINYMHWGETKTWYGIPGEDADKFEAAMKSEAPDLFEAQPDLLFQLVTLMNPEHVKRFGVRVFRCHQRAGEFVITFPKSYHCGFNHGFNFNEAVNFALPDWLAYDRECVQRYRVHRKLPVFSHDELLITITQQSQSIKTAMWLHDSLKEMMARERHNRLKAREIGLVEVLEEKDRPEEQYQCAICKAFCYLSQVTSICTSMVACVEHAHLLCDKHEHRPSYILRKRFSDAELEEIEFKVAERAAVPSAWQAKLGRILMDSATPALRSLRAILAEGERISFPLPELGPLRKCVNKANEWIEEANNFLVRKQGRKRARRGKRGNAALINDDDKPDQSLSDLYDLLKKVDPLGFECPEISALQSLAAQAEDYKTRAKALISRTGPQDNDYIDECRSLILDGSSLNVHLDELLQVEGIVEKVTLNRELAAALDDADTSLTLDEIRRFLTRCRSCPQPVEPKYVRMLEQRQLEGSTLEDRAKNILAQPIKTIEELNAFSNLDPNIPIDSSVLERLKHARDKAKDFEKQATDWLQPPAGAAKPRPSDVMRLVQRAEKDFKILAVEDVKSAAKIAVDLEARCSTVLQQRYRRSPNEDLFATLDQWRTYTRDHLSMFNLVAFESLELQLIKHSDWLKEIPWYSQSHREETQAILKDVEEVTSVDSEVPPKSDFITCICPDPVSPPPAGQPSDAVQCDYCYARFHGVCANNGGSCPFCDQQHWTGVIPKKRNWHFCYLPNLLDRAPPITRHYSDEYRMLKVIVHKVDKLSSSIGHFLSFVNQPMNSRPDYIHQVRHWMRKLYKLQFLVSPDPAVSYGLDLTQAHRNLASRPHKNRREKRRRPKFVFGQDGDQDWTDGTRCICRGRTLYLLNYATVKCNQCSKLYHAGCVFYPHDNSTAPSARGPFMCPLCCLRTGVAYQYAEVRVKPFLDAQSAHLAPELYIDTEAMLKSCSRDLVYRAMRPPYVATLFVELVKVVPGEGDGYESPLDAAHRHHGRQPLPPHMAPHPGSMHPGAWSHWGAVHHPSQSVAIPPPVRYHHPIQPMHMGHPHPGHPGHPAVIHPQHMGHPQHIHPGQRQHIHQPPPRPLPAAPSKAILPTTSPLSLTGKRKAPEEDPSPSTKRYAAAPPVSTPPAGISRPVAAIPPVSLPGQALVANEVAGATPSTEKPTSSAVQARSPSVVTMPSPMQVGLPVAPSAAPVVPAPIVQSTRDPPAVLTSQMPATQPSQPPATSTGPPPAQK
ncbi:hypothetical protein CYLTODRAFT_416517 [Cylindrobasidium torrendii FP15055 ss-10]|uniref:[histone H3]-trimethyl-L-lysine(4) demethylase n=1 Tax=Cylindrobasidium torrendii FP15055 ss-10 TaxID=1314674 RepID=A0A0D7BTX5_9AGAR|nr:hypothetical protein CYLTODRAFT_416517 [Cylindrobasidium torrendii FP15055 ss-10]